MKNCGLLLLLMAFGVSAQEQKMDIKVSAQVKASCKFTDTEVICTPGTKVPERYVVQRTIRDEEGTERPTTVQEFIY